MTLSEFKAWFEGFTEDLDGAPSKKQWDRIKGRVGEITGQTVSYPIYIDRYVRPNPGYWPYWQGYNGISAGNAGLAAQSSDPRARAQAYRGALGGESERYNSHDAMKALGLADAQAIKAD